MKKTLYTLNINKEYAPEITAITYPLMMAYAEKCGAAFHIITERKSPGWPLTFEKLQVYDLAKQREDDWIYFFDSDALIHPDTFDPTEMIGKDCCMHNGQDMAANRFKYDKYFRRDSRHIGSGTWICVCSDWTLDLWHPPDDIDLLECLDNIQPTVYEVAHGITKEHLIDDYLLSRNIAKYGLKYVTYMDLTKRLGRAWDYYFWHQYTIPIPEKVKQMKKTLRYWTLESVSDEKQDIVDSFIYLTDV